MWGKFFKPGPNQTSISREAINDGDEFLENRLEQLHYRANPQFEQALKARLLANLTAQPTPTAKNKWRQFNPSRSAAIILTGAVSLALVVLLLSVLTAQLPAQTVSQLGSVATVVPAEQTAQTSAETTSETAITAAPLAFSSPAGQANNAGSPYQAVVVQTGGFAPQTPDYVPPGYSLQISVVVTPDEKSAQPFNGYYLRYQPASEKDKTEAALEISQWQVPFEVKVTAQAAPTSVRHPGQAPSTLVMGAQKVLTTTVRDQPAYNLTGPHWRLQLLDLNAGPQPASAELPQPGTRPGFGGMPVTAPGRSGPAVSFGRLPGRNDYFIDYAWRGSPKNVRTVLWQRDKVLTVVSANSLSDAELAKVAGSIK